MMDILWFLEIKRDSIQRFLIPILDFGVANISQKTVNNAYDNVNYLNLYVTAALPPSA